MTLHKEPNWTAYWLSFDNGETPATTHVHEEFMDSITPTDTVLDLGCGFGRKTVLFSERAKNVIGVDINPKEVAFAALHNRRANVNYAVMNGAELGFRNESFDKAALLGVLGGVSLGTRIAILSEAHRVLKPGGTLYTGEFCMESPSPYSEAMYARGERVTGEYGSVVVRGNEDEEADIKFISKHFRVDEVADLLGDQGFQYPVIRTATVTRKALFDSTEEYQREVLCTWATKKG